jgi:hypothetical protein
MIAPPPPAAACPPLDLSKWRNLPNRFLGAGAVLVLIGLVVSGVNDGFRQFGYSWLLAFMFFLSLCMGALFLVLAHHLFDAGWSVPLRRVNEHLACLAFPWMAIFFIPIALLAPRIYQWMGPQLQTNPDHSLHSKWPMFTLPGFYLISALCFLVWWTLTRGLRQWSIAQDTTGAALCTYRMRFYSYWGIFAFALSVTLAAIMWMKALMYEWFSTMYGVWYFAASVWLTLGTIYVITLILDRQKVTHHVLHEHQYYFLGSVFFAFTVFYAYVTFAQYFIIWNANMPEETFWYVLRERGTWFYVGVILIFGHFFVPFLSLLRIDVKSTFPIMIGLAAWAWLMHYVDMAFNIKPAADPTGFPFRWVWLDLGCMALIGGVLAKVFLRDLAAHAPFPIKDPRLSEAMGLRSPVPTQISGGELDEVGEDLAPAPQATGGAR